MSQPAAARMTSAWLTAALDRSPSGVAAFDADWTFVYANPAVARLLGRSGGALTGSNLWIALPELGGTPLHGVLVHARTAGTPVTWRGRYAPARRWLSVTAEPVQDLLQVHVHEVAAPRAEEAGPAYPGGPDEPDADRERLRFLAEVSETMINNLDVHESATQLAEVVLPRLADCAVVALIGEDRSRAGEAWAHRDAAGRADLDTYMRGRLHGTGDDGAMVSALLSGRPVQLTSIDQQQVAPSLPTPQVRAAWERLDLTSCTIVPLRARGDTFGVLALLNAGTRPPHTELEIATAVEVARRGALALDNARLYGRQHRVAETLQRSLLTPPPRPDRLQIAVRYRPATSHALVGGDFYDAFVLPDGATVLVIGDVVGHSVEAAAAMSQLRSTVRALAYDRPDSPAQTLTRTDRALSGLRFGTLATALLARIEQPAEQARDGLRTLRWSSAGHPPPLLVRPDGAVQLLDCPPERLLGTDEPGRRTDHTAVLQPGTTVLLVTDGLIEHGRTGIDEGLTRLASTLTGLRDLPLEELCDRLLDRVLTGRADDDIALLAVRCCTRDA
ncbi:SpoIIE family protein phosphatase [Geodermatophilus saharensis]|uniref:SpoIIE family protein phosphatase n=1 Tax=Geodermatophilus saharensis TaxID=1137994 RepID=UPI000B788371|nr:SpoIIE family protein phosphatase [Geodermatophilus saharensis]